MSNKDGSKRPYGAGKKPGKSPDSSRGQKESQNLPPHMQRQKESYGRSARSA